MHSICISTLLRYIALKKNHGKLFMRLLFFLCYLLTSISILANGQMIHTQTCHHDHMAIPFQPFYLGTILGYGNTNWHQLVNDNGMTDYSTPIRANDDGTAWGFVAGYYLSPTFAFEATYIKYPDARIKFSEYSTYWPITHIFSRTHTYSLMGKFSTPIRLTKLRAFAGLGVAIIQRHDKLANTAHVGATFIGGFQRTFNQHLLTEIGFQYATGYGKSNIHPAHEFIPFLYAVYTKIAWRFSWPTEGTNLQDPPNQSWKFP